MKDLVEYIARSLVDHPEEVSVLQSGRGAETTLELQVARDDMGRVIGKGGQVANAIRILLRIAASREDKRVNLDIIEPE